MILYSITSARAISPRARLFSSTPTGTCHSHWSRPVPGQPHVPINVLTTTNIAKRSVTRSETLATRLPSDPLHRGTNPRCLLSPRRGITISYRLKKRQRSVMSTTYTAGKYLAEILHQGFEKSPVKGTSCFVLQLKVLARLDAYGRQQPCPQYERS